MYEQFRYIVPQDDKVDIQPNQIIQNKYKTIQELVGKCVVYAAGKGYRIYSSHECYIIDLVSMPECDRVFHEVIFSNCQKLKFDIDAPSELLEQFKYNLASSDCDHPIEHFDDFDPDLLALLDDLAIEIAQPVETTNIAIDIVASKYQHVFETILAAIKDAFFTTYWKELEPRDIIICESNGDDKFSNHIIIANYMVSNHFQALEFSRKVLSYLPVEYRVFFDSSVYKSTQNFRSILCHKKDSTRVMNLTTQHAIIDTLITYTDNCELLPDISAAVIRPISENIPTGDVGTILKICAESIVDHVFDSRHGDMFIFKRTHPGLCSICNVVHDTDNSAMVSASINDETPDFITLFMYCRRYIHKYGKDGGHFKTIGSFMSEMIKPIDDIKATNVTGAIKTIAKYPAIIRNYVDKTILLNLGKKNLFPTTTLFDKLTNKNIYDEPTLRPFELVPTLVVHAAMKMGKTKALGEYLNRNFTDGLHKNIIRFVSFRQTFSGNIKEKFPEFTLYSDVKGTLAQARLIVQVESLWRLEPSLETPDLLILDECESIFEQFDSGLLRGNFNDCFAKFTYLLKYSKHVVCMDAGIGDRTARILEKIRGGECRYHHNTHTNATADNYYFGGDKMKWLGILYNDITDNRKVACPMSSHAEAKTLERNLRKRFPNLRMKIYSSETASSEKTLHFADVNKYWANYDVLIYTPTVTAGVSFECKHFDAVYGYFTDKSCPVETAIQMIGRIRDVASHKHFVHFSATGNNLPIEIDEIKKLIIGKRNNLHKNFDDTGLTVTYGNDGKANYDVAPYFHVWVENARMRNISNNAYVKRFLHNIYITAAKSTFLSDEVYTAETGMVAYINGKLSPWLQQIADEHSDSKKEIVALECARVVGAEEITPDVADEIRADLLAQKDVSNDRRDAYVKYRLRTEYNFHGELTDKFVEVYREQSTRQIFRNLLKITADDDINVCLKNIQLEERALNTYYTDSGDLNGINNDLNYKYMYDLHRYSIVFLKMCGFKHITDPQCIHRNVICANLRAWSTRYWDIIRPACTSLEVKTPDIKVPTEDVAFVKHLLDPVNKVLQKMYGISIITTRAEPDVFKLSKITLFTTDPAKSASKKIPLLTRVAKTQVV